MSSNGSPSRGFSGRSAGATAAGLALACLVGVFLGLGLYTIDYADATAYLSNDPRACANCHIMRDELDGWQKASHHAVTTCNDCHVPQDLIGKYTTKADHGYRHSKGFTFQDFHEPIQIKPHSLDVVQRNCLRCHGELVEQLAAHAPIRAAAGEGPEILACVHCHRGVGHGARP